MLPKGPSNKSHFHLTGRRNEPLQLWLIQSLHDFIGLIGLSIGPGFSLIVWMIQCTADKKCSSHHWFPHVSACTSAFSLFLWNLSTSTGGTGPLCAPAKTSGSATRFQTQVHSVSFYFSAGRKIEKKKTEKKKKKQKKREKKQQLQNIHTAEV